jgi:type VI secretion system protein ImpG
MFNKYYQDELTFLREMGREFSQSYPALAHMLAERGSDPDVERMLEGFAFLAGRIRQKLDDEFPELTQGLLSLLWPHYLRPVPSMSVLEFKPVPNALRERKQVPRGTAVASVPVEGTRCTFQTCYATDLYPLELTHAEVEEKPGAPPTLRLGLQLGDGVQLKQLQLGTLRLFLHGDLELTSLIYMWLVRNLKEVVVQGFLEGRPTQQLVLPASAVRPVGFADEEALLPYPQSSFSGFRLLQEYFALPAKFMFVELSGLQEAAELETGRRLELHFRFKPGQDKPPRVGADNFRLFCTPVLNLFPHTADPIRLEHERVEYRIRPAAVDSTHYEIYSVDKVVGWVEGQSRPREYAPFYSFTHDTGGEREPIFYQVRLRGSVTGTGTDSFISFVSEQEAHVFPPAETISLDLTCTNRRLADHLRVGDIRAATATSPEYATFGNVTGLTPSIRPPVDRGLHWRLLSHLALNYLSLVNVDALRSILEVYNFQALVDRQAARENQLRLEGIQRVRSSPIDWLFKGAPVRGTAIELELLESSFSGEGDLYLFSTILNELFALYASLNSFTRLTVRGAKEGEVYQWPPRLGRQILA